MIHRCTFLFLFVLASCTNNPGTGNDEAQVVQIANADELAAGIMLQAKVAVLNQVMAESGAFRSSALAIDFQIFGSGVADINGLTIHLSEDYEIASREIADDGYAVVEFTTRPRAIELSAEEHFERIASIAEAAKLYGCIFSTWSIEDTESGLQWSAEVVDGSG